MGGRRRSAVNKPVPKRRPKLDKVFKCPVCSHDGSMVQITQKEKGLEAVISCKVCKESHRYTKRVTFLTEPVDVFSDWLDSLEAKKKRANQTRQPTRSPVKKAPSKEDEEDNEDEDDILNAPSVKKKAKVDEEAADESEKGKVDEDNDDEEEEDEEDEDEDEEEDEDDE